jgi:hypothetical protein
MNEVSLFRLYVLRAMYLFIVVGPCPAASRTCPIRRKRSSRSPRTTGAEAPILKYE